MNVTLGLRRAALLASLGLVGTAAAQQLPVPPPAGGSPTVLVLPPAGAPTTPLPPPPPGPVAPITVPPPPQIVDLTPAEPVHKPIFESHPEGCKPEECKPAFLTSIEYLLVRPRRRGNDYAIVDPNGANLTPEGRIKSVGFETDSGLRASVGYRSPSGWEVLFTYYYLHSGDANTVAAPAGGLLYATLTRPGLVDQAAFAAADTSLNLQVYDLEAARTFHADDSLSFRVSFGPRIASMGQDLNAYYFGGDATGTAVRTRTEFDLGGVTAGGQAEWLFGHGLRVYGKSRASLLYGQFTNTLRETDNGGLTLNADVSEHYSAAVPVIELGAGLAYEYKGLRVAVGYEVQNWFNVIDSPAFTNDFAEGKIGRRKSDLSLEGLFFQLGLTY
ncbi:MAG: Lpg1974 family pore-forming outer membrane protein [Gemmataceae bacterium]